MAEMLAEFDAILLTHGAGTPRDLNIPGRELSGIHFAMEFLTQQNRLVAGEEIPAQERISASNKNVLVIGGGDTGSDCIGTSIRQGAKRVTQIELLPKPPEKRRLDNPWPTWPQVLRTSTSHYEGAERMWSIGSKSFMGGEQGVTGLQAVRLEWGAPGQKPAFTEALGSEFVIQAELVLLAMGFVHVEHGPIVKDLNLALTPQGNIKVDHNFMTSHPKVFAAGDAETGASLVVRAINRGRLAAEKIDRFLS
jgi:NADPH-dependent glutamate synthase beta subunit-like oxidoreductase